jgi:hypothetical protein
MEKFRGILQIRHCNEQSRSEGEFAFLVAEGGSELELCREGGLPFNDPYYEPYSDLQVEIVGEVRHGVLVVESIEEWVATPEEDVHPTEEQEVEK